MAGRPRLYATAAERTRAYRARRENQRVWIHQIDWEELDAHLERLMRAVNHAQYRADALARSLKSRSRLEMLASLAAHFESVKGSEEEN